MIHKITLLNNIDYYYNTESRLLYYDNKCKKVVRTQFFSQEELKLFRSLIKDLK